MDNIGKEADRWEEQYYLGLDLDAQIEYGAAPEEQARLNRQMVSACRRRGIRRAAEAAGVDHGQLSRALQRGTPPAAMLRRVHALLDQLDADDRDYADRVQRVIAAVKQGCQTLSLRQLAKLAGVDPGTLFKVVVGQRQPSQKVIQRLEAAIAKQGTKVGDQCEPRWV